MDRTEQLRKTASVRASADQRSRSLHAFLARWAKRHMSDRVVFRRRRVSRLGN